jgi:hypothetical protein
MQLLTDEAIAFPHTCPDYPPSMAKRVGIIQTRAIGDIIIALPIADHFIEQGCEVYWPIERTFEPAFRRVKPDIHFIPLEFEPNYWYQTPLAKLRELACEEIFPLYSYLKSDEAVPHRGLAASLKFDEYKYAIAGVPFARKWDLRLQRDMQREMELHKRLNITKPYICRHMAGKAVTYQIRVPREWENEYQVIDISELTDSPFDWIYTLEHASKLILIDSCFANLVEQLNLPMEKRLLLVSRVEGTPVMKNGWKFISPLPK